MKKIILSSILMLNAAVFAAGVGYIDYNYIYENLEISKQYRTKIEAKAKEIKNYTKETQKQMNSKKEIEEKNAVISSRKAGLTKLKKEYNALIIQQENTVRAKVQAASDAVLTQKNLDMIINKKARVSGGVDCTTDVMKAIK